MVKDDRDIDRFDQAVAAAFGGLETITPESVLDALDMPAAAAAWSKRRQFSGAVRVRHLEHLLPQLRLRESLARQPPSVDGADTHMERPPHLRNLVEVNRRR